MASTRRFRCPRLSRASWLWLPVFLLYASKVLGTVEAFVPPSLSSSSSCGRRISEINWKQYINGSKRQKLNDNFFQHHMASSNDKGEEGEDKTVLKIIDESDATERPVIGKDSSEVNGKDELAEEAAPAPTPTPTEEPQILRRQSGGGGGPTARDLMRAMGTSPRRIFLGTASATGIALAGNFLGVTSKLLTLVPEEVLEPTGIDTYFPRGDYKRVKGKGYNFVIPKEWVGDTFVELAKAQRATRPLDYNMRQGGSSVTLPDAAFGPPGRLNPRTGVSEEGDTNVSVIVSGGLSGFSLKGTLGSPTEAAEKLIRLSLAPEGSGRTINLRNAFEDVNRQVYQLEYDVDRSGRRNLAPLRAISIIAAGVPEGTKLITLTVTAPKEAWDTDATLATKLERIASSFHTTS